MMDFILIPTIIGIITYGIYKLFELFVRKKERLNIIEKFGDKFNPTDLDLKLSMLATENVEREIYLATILLKFEVNFPKKSIC